MLFVLFLVVGVAVILYANSQRTAKLRAAQAAQAAGRLQAANGSAASPIQYADNPPVPTFCGPGQTQVVAGRSIPDPLTYFAPAHPYGDASAIDPNLPVGYGARADELPYWPSYANASPDQRARYLAWLASGKRDPAVPIGYVFVYFYGFERAALLDRIDPDFCTREVGRLVSIYGPLNRSFDGYARRFLAFIHSSSLPRLAEADVVSLLGPLDGVEPAIDGVLAWYHDHQRPLPPEFAFVVAREMDGAKGGVVLQRALDEFRELFSARYTAKYGEGMRLVAAKRPRKLEYRAASPSLLYSEITTTVSNVLGRSAQFKPLVAIWNGCIDDLRKLSRKRAGQEGELTAEMWDALPSELRADVEHPDADRWAEIVAAAPAVDGFHILDYAVLAPLVGLSPTEKVTAGQAKRIAERAEVVGFGLEPDARLVGKGAPVDAAVVLWPHRGDTAVDKKAYLASRNLLTLLLEVAAADGSIDDEELGMVEKLIEETFALDDVMRKRLAALREVLLRVPARGTTIARRIKENRTPEQVEAVGFMLVDVAAVDGVLDPGEHKALKALFRSLGLSKDFLDAALVRADLRVESRKVHRAGRSKTGKGEAIQAPTRIQLDPARIARLQAETAEVARILADVLDADDEEEAESGAPGVAAAAPAPPRAAAPSNGSALSGALAGLDERYHPVVAQLCQKPHWSMSEAKELAKRHRVMPAAVIETVNEWAEELHGDVLIEEVDGWQINPDVTESLHR